MKKLIIKLFFWIIMLFLLVFCVFLGLGYLKYKNAINALSLDEAISEIQNKNTYINLDNISKDYQNAVIAIEDHRFYNHSGIDLITIVRSVYVNITSKSLNYGGSTITQQVARNIYFTQEKSPVRKIAEIFVAFDLEKNYSKDEILELYANIIYFGNGYYGINQASYGYFQKDSKDLTPYEATYLAGLPNAPSIYSENEKLAEERRLQVINAMKKYGYID